MKTISVMIPTYNEEENVLPICEAIKEQLAQYAGRYNYEIVFIDNCSTDHTRELLREMCIADKRVKAILNAKNFGQGNSPYYGLCQTIGDCTIYMVADFQDPPEIIPRLITEWENGYKIVAMIKTSSKESKLMYFVRSCYYKLVKSMSHIEIIEHFTGSGLYDKSFIDVLRNLDDTEPFLRGIVAELGFKRKDVEYTQQKRRAGKSTNNFFTLYDYAMISVTAYTKTGLRIATFFGMIVSILSILVSLVYFVLKLIFWPLMSFGMAPLTIGVFFIGGLQLFFLGFVGEYIMAINKRVMHHPLVIEEERINFENSTKSQPSRSSEEKALTEQLRI
ncbi:MAG: glycosyltransferase family 2 protein [Clostridiales bacterium]|jgi:glycosyltransferase involved in cell wall biosynthesis|nr:glycosyltransferase family 2 protein [Clostridiales bacterium]